MRITKPAFFLLLVFLLGNAGFALAETDTVPPQIINPDTVPVRYCSDSVTVAPNITIQSIKIDESDEGMKVSIANYQRGEDKLVYEVVDKFKDGYRWNDSKGELEIRGIGSEEEYRDAISKVYYKNISEVPEIGIRSFSISLLDADYLPETQHFYRYIKKLDITWKEARDEAASLKYYGLQGYLATITSSAENDFIWTKIDGVGWIGASDEAKEGEWKWVTGPEAGTVFWNGNQHGSPVPGQYNFWNNGEPNNLGEEHFAHINANPNTIPKSWNDLPNQTNPNSQHYRAQGYIVEYGGMKNDPPVKLSAEARVEVAKIAFSDEREFEICEGESQQLNLAADTSYSYSWTPVDGTITNPIVSNPIVNPIVTSVYTAVGNLGFCTDSANFTVKVNPAPISELNKEEIICKGDSITLDPGLHSAYLWSNGKTSRSITVADENKYWVELSSAVPCVIVDTVQVKWSERPVLDYSAVDTLVCGRMNQVLDITFISGDANTTLVPLDPTNSTVRDANSTKPTVTVSKYGKYQFEMQMVDVHGCQFLDTLHIEFHNQPKAIIVMDEEECKGYNLRLDFGGETKEEAVFTWYYNDSIYRSEVDLFNVEIPLGFGVPGRSVGLKVNEQGCVADTIIPVIVTPNVEIVTQNNEGCTPLLVDFKAKATEEINSYLWDFGDGNSSTDSTTSNEYTNSSTIDIGFDVALTVTSTEGCTNTGVMNSLVLVHPIPTVDLSFDETACNPMQMEIWYEGSANEADSFYWDLSAFNSDEIVRNPGTNQGPLEIKRSSAPTASIGISVVSEFACISETLIKPWKRKPDFEIEVDTTRGCPPLAVLAEAKVLDLVDDVSFTYDLGDGTSGSGNRVEHIYPDANTRNRIQFTGISAITGCTETVVYTDTVFVYPSPIAGFVPNPENVVVSDPEIVFENSTTGAIEYEWDFGDMSAISTEHSPTHRYTGMGFYKVSLFAYNALGCLDSISNQVAVAFDKLFPPNAFSPNATKKEDREFRIHSEGVADEGYQLLIFNRWGEVVFESNSQTIGWNGKLKNDKLAPGGVYTWVLQYADFRDEKRRQQGTLTLIL